MMYINYVKKITAFFVCLGSSCFGDLGMSNSVELLLIKVSKVTTIDTLSCNTNDSI